MSSAAAPQDVAAAWPLVPSLVSLALHVAFAAVFFQSRFVVYGHGATFALFVFCLARTVVFALRAILSVASLFTVRLYFLYQVMLASGGLLLVLALALAFSHGVASTHSAWAPEGWRAERKLGVVRGAVKAAVVVIMVLAGIAAVRVSDPSTPPDQAFAARTVGRVANAAALGLCGALLAGFLLVAVRITGALRAARSSEAVPMVATEGKGSERPSEILGGSARFRKTIYLVYIPANILLLVRYAFGEVLLFYDTTDAVYSDWFWYPLLVLPELLALLILTVPQAFSSEM